jgi:peptidylprolyl isomerase
MKLIVHLATSLLIMIATSCQDKTATKDQQPYSYDELIEANKRKVGQERNIIESFVAKSGHEMLTSPTGLRYYVYGHGTGDSARAGQIATIIYSAYLLDSTVVSSATAKNPLIFKIGESDVVSGLHEAVTLLREGDSARFVIPSHMAYGLTGNSPTVPPNAALYYDLQLLAIY